MPVSTIWSLLAQPRVTSYTTDAAPVEGYFDLTMNVLIVLIFGVVSILGIAGVVYAVYASQNNETTRKVKGHDFDIYIFCNFVNVDDYRT